MLARLFRHGEITYHGAFVSLASGRMAPLTVGGLRHQAKSALPILLTRTATSRTL
jgi:hypothetical protein